MIEEIFSDPACDKCNGQGMYLHEITGGAAHCDCHVQNKVRVMKRRSGIFGAYLGCKVSNYKPENEQEVAVKSAVKQWVENYTKRCKGMILLGPPGTGKTHLLSAVCLALIEHKDTQAVYASSTELVEKWQRTFRHEEVLTDPFEELAMVPVLALDDVGAEKPSEGGNAKFSELIDCRYRNSRTTLITSNLTMNAIEEVYGPRLADRLYEMCDILLCNGPSRRRKN